MLSVKQGKELIKLARESISSEFSNKRLKINNDLKKEFGEARGAFVTLSKGNALRGCIGFPDPVFPLYNAVLKAAKSAAFSDPRFPPLSKEEFDDITIEVSVLTLPKMVEVRNPEDYLTKIKVGRDGLIAKGVYESGLLLPQVAVEYNWDVQTFLDQVCIKANLQSHSWTDFDKVRIYSFQSMVFSEESPNGNVIKKM